jgi:hypothetical protein
VDDYSSAWDLVADVIRNLGIRSGVGVPITVEGRLWGVMTIASIRDRAGEQTACQHLQLRYCHGDPRPGMKPLARALSVAVTWVSPFDPVFCGC